MKSLAKLCLLATIFATAKVLASDPFLEFNGKEYGVSVTRERNVKDYEGVKALKGEDPHRLRVLVTTESLTPDAETYAVAEGFFEGLRRTYSMAEFKVFGRMNNEGLAKEICANYDYVFMIGTNQSTSDYERDETVYGSRASSVRCSRSPFNDDVDCREIGSQSIPIGTRKAKGTIFTDIFFANYGPARQTSAYWHGQNLIPGLGVRSPIGHIAVVMRYGMSDASWCENQAGAQVTLARMAGFSVLSSRPDKVNFYADPDDIGCED